jgi:hypothetical protein
MDNLIDLYNSKLASANNFEEISAFLGIQEPFPTHLCYRLQYFYCTRDLSLDILKPFKDDSRISIINEKASSFVLNVKGAHKQFTVPFTITPTSVKRLYILGSLSYSSDWNLLLANLLKNKYPNIVLFYWKQRDLTRALKILEGSVQSRYKLLIKELSIKEKRDDQSHPDDTRKRSYLDKYDSLREWTSKPLSQVLDEALQREQWFKKIKFQLFVNAPGSFLGEPLATCSISKLGSISFNNFYPLFTSSLCRELEPAYAASIDLYANRGLKERDYIPSKPIAIEYDYDLFDKEQQMLTFKKLIRRFPNSSKAYYHSNPYFHVSIADFKDSSSYDVFISNPKRILIIPKIRTSIESLERFVSFVFYEFREGTVKELDETWKTA